MGNQIAPGIYATTVPIYVIFYLSFLATLCQEMSFCLSCDKIDVKMYYPFDTETGEMRVWSDVNCGCIPKQDSV